MNKDVWQIFNTRSKYQKNTDSINKSEKYRIPHPLVESYFLLLFSNTSFLKTFDPSKNYLRIDLPLNPLHPLRHFDDERERKASCNG